MADPGFALQKAIYSALDGALSIPVYDAVPQSSDFPYVTIDSQVAAMMDSHSTRRDDRFVYLTVWSEYGGQKQVLDTMAEIDTALHDQKLALETGRVVILNVIRKRTVREPDAETFQGQVTLRVVTEH